MLTTRLLTISLLTSLAMHTGCAFEDLEDQDLEIVDPDQLDADLDADAATDDDAAAEAGESTSSWESYRLCYPGGRCPAIMIEASYFRSGGMTGGGCMTWTTSASEDGTWGGTMGTAEIRNCYPSEPTGNIIDIFSGHPHTTIWSRRGIWGGPVW
jgi:hypothetical protein